MNDAIARDRARRGRCASRWRCSPRAQRRSSRTKPVEFVVHTGPGGGNDVLARAIAAMAEKENLLPVRMQVVNKPGGNGAVAAAYLAEKKGDPHTIGLFTSVWLAGPLTSAEAKVTVQRPDADRAARARAGGRRGQRRRAVQDA